MPTEPTKLERPVFAAPEPDLTPQQLVDRAVELRPMLLEQQDGADARGYYSKSVHDAFTRAGIYRCLQPRMFGGYEFDITTFFRVIVEIARGGGGGIGWCASLSSGHALVVGAHWGEQGQREIFGKEYGHFVAPHRTPPDGTVHKLDGGYIVNGRWAYSSGAPYATHFLGGAILVDASGGALKVDDASPPQITVCVPSEQFTVLNDWGGNSPTASLGLQASGSNTIVVENQFVPDHLVLYHTHHPEDRPTPTAGVRLHGNPMYICREHAFYQGELVSVVVGTARAALDEYERLLISAPSRMDSGVPRYQQPLFQEPFGLALALVDSAEHILLHIGHTYMLYCARWARTGEPFTLEEDLRLYGALQQAARLCFHAVETLLRTAGPNMARKGSRLERYFRDVSTYRVHGASQEYAFASVVARAHFGLPVGHLFAS